MADLVRLKRSSEKIRFGNPPLATVKGMITELVCKITEALVIHKGKVTLDLLRTNIKSRTALIINHRRKLEVVALAPSTMVEKTTSNKTETR